MRRYVTLIFTTSLGTTGFSGLAGCGSPKSIICQIECRVIEIRNRKVENVHDVLIFAEERQVGKEAEIVVEVDRLVDERRRTGARNRRCWCILWNTTLISCGASGTSVRRLTGNCFLLDRSSGMALLAFRLPVALLSANERREANSSSNWQGQSEPLGLKARWKTY